MMTRCSECGIACWPTGPIGPYLCTRCSIEAEAEFLAMGKVLGFDTDNITNFPRNHAENIPANGGKRTHSLNWYPKGGFK